MKTTILKACMSSSQYLVDGRMNNTIEFDGQYLSLIGAERMAFFDPGALIELTDHSGKINDIDGNEVFITFTPRLETASEVHAA